MLDSASPTEEPLSSVPDLRLRRCSVREHPDESPCGLEVEPDAPILICPMHVAAAYRYAMSRITKETEPPDLRVKRLRESSEWTAMINREKAKVQAELAGDVEGSWVYYIRVGDQIKIGVSIDPLKRAQSLSLTAAHIVATEPGTSLLEAKRHSEFRALHIHGEWFRAEGRLLDHIAALQAQAA